MMYTARRMASRLASSPKWQAVPGLLALRALRDGRGATFPVRRSDKVYGKIGTLEVRLTRRRRDIRLAQRLRYQVFYEEMSAVPSLRAELRRRDEDPYDAVCDHLLVVDSGPRRRVLLAEDNEINSLLAKRVLEKCGCDYLAVPNGAEAVAAVRATLDGDTPAFDLILMDIFMPQLDGIEAARGIRALYAAPAGDQIEPPPIVALTASAFAEDKKRYLEAGMDDYLAKPFDKASLEAVLRRWFGQTKGGDADAAA